MKKPATTRTAKKGAAAASTKAAKAAAAKVAKDTKTAAKAKAAEEKELAKKAAADAKAKTKTDNPRGVTGDNSTLTVDQKRALHFNHKKLYEDALKVKKAADKAMLDVGKLIKSEGGSVKLIKQAIKMDSPEGEAEIRADIEATLEIARFEGSAMGHQMQLLMDPPAVDVAFDKGKIAGLKALPRKPPYDSSVPQYKRWFEGYDAGQAVVTAKFKEAKPTGGTKRQDDTPKGSEPKDAKKTEKAADAKPDAAKAAGGAPAAGKDASNVVPIKETKTPTPPPPPEETNLQMGGTPPAQPELPGTKH